MALPFAIHFAVVSDLALTTVAAVTGSEHATLAPQPIAQFGILVATGIVVHEIGGMAIRAAKAVYRRRQHRP